MNKNIVKQYRAHLELPGDSVVPAAIVGDLTCESLKDLKERVNIFLGGDAKFENTSPTAGNPVTLIFHPNWNKGQSPVGCISPFEIHESMTVGTTIEKLQEEAAA